MNLTIGIVIAVVAIVAVGYLIASRYYVASPDEALIVTGRKTKSSIDASGREIADLTNQRVIVGGGVFVIPFVQRLYRLSLASRKIVMQIEAIDINSIPIDVKAVAVVKIGGTETAIRSAAQRFLNQQNQMADTVQELMAGSLRSVIGSMNVKEIITDREALSTKVLQAAQESLTEQGLTLDTLQVQDISDANGYLESMSAPKVAEVRREANIANAAAHQKSEEARIEAERQVVLKSKDLALQKAAIKVETDRADAQASAAGPIQAAQMDREIATSQNQAAKERAELRATELIAEVERPADAARYKTVVEAEASKSQAIAQAEARARASTIEAEARAAASKIEAQARAEARRAEAGAEAEAVRLAGQAEADKTAAMARAEAERALERRQGRGGGHQRQGRGHARLRRGGRPPDGRRPAAQHRPGDGGAAVLHRPDVRGLHRRCDASGQDRGVGHRPDHGVGQGFDGSGPGRPVPQRFDRRNQRPRRPGRISGQLLQGLEQLFQGLSDRRTARPSADPKPKAPADEIRSLAVPGRLRSCRGRIRRLIRPRQADYPAVSSAFSAFLTFSPPPLSPHLSPFGFPCLPRVGTRLRHLYTPPHPVKPTRFLHAPR